MTQAPLKITHDLNMGNSFGLEYPIIYGWRPDLSGWCAWDRHTGEVKLWVAKQENANGFDFSAQIVYDFAYKQVPKEKHDPFLYDSIS